MLDLQLCVLVSTQGKNVVGGVGVVTVVVVEVLVEVVDVEVVVESVPSASDNRPNNAKSFLFQ